MSNFAERLEALKERIAVASHGPWETEKEPYEGSVAQSGQDDWYICHCRVPNGENSKNNAAYIAAASPDFILELIAKYEAATKWIRVEQELPPEEDAVIVIWMGIVQHLTYSRRDGEWYPHHAQGDDEKLPVEAKFTHWMPLPTPPAVTKEEE